MSRVRLTRRAERDLFEIFLFGIETFGLARAAGYREAFETCFNMLARHPELGRRCPELGEAMRRHEHGSHVVLYEIDLEGVLIVAVPHRRSAMRLLEP
ncbi:type II toxin-antitoxin system RelE/ParE family toxin [Chelatococcus sambhunathii]|uniref:Toxin n=1 Tax=Chelatococcus sambhunathii TaxID=363953 RepID=A0ABU1DCF0_9HYPH|nr:type II toxin-antitoxin system RelE/ParE family toxin [Chelatococcus sambhunathii]MDR4305783.1 type II toxin-antitoxin system RelE/ParE family toxin [Chelatococcus sambhunathii]